MIMKPRLNPYQAAPGVMKAMMALEAQVAQSALEPSLVQLIKIRASQVNSCAFGLHMHTHEARAKGETEERIYLLDAWRESPLYNERERAALAWTEAVTLVSQTHVPNEVYAEARAQFSEEDLVRLTLLVNAINAWNRFAIAFRSIHPTRVAKAA
jgi:AhpD family alkylhydroperoxidase